MLEKTSGKKKERKIKKENFVEKKEKKEKKAKLVSMKNWKILYMKPNFLTTI